VIARVKKLWMVPGVFASVGAAWMLGSEPPPAAWDLVRVFSVALIFFLSGWTIPTRQLAAAVAGWKFQAFVFAISFLIFPAVVLAVLAAPDNALPDGLRTGMVALAVLPTTVTTCVALTRVAGGDEAAALVNAVASNLAGVILSPALLILLLGRAGGIDAAAVFRELAGLVILPLAAGQAARYAVRRPGARASGAASVAVQAAVLMILFVSAWKLLPAGIPINGGQAALLAGLCAGLHAAAFAGGWAGSRLLGLDRGGRIAAAFCGSQKSLATGLPMLTVAFAGHPSAALVVLPLIFFHLIQLVADTFLAAAIHSKAA